MVTRDLGRGSGANALLESLKGNLRRACVPGPLLGCLVIEGTLKEDRKREKERGKKKRKRKKNECRGGGGEKKCEICKR